MASGTLAVMWLGYYIWFWSLFVVFKSSLLTDKGHYASCRNVLSWDPCCNKGQRHHRLINHLATTSYTSANLVWHPRIQCVTWELLKLWTSALLVELRLGKDFVFTLSHKWLTMWIRSVDDVMWRHQRVINKASGSICSCSSRAANLASLMTWAAAWRRQIGWCGHVDQARPAWLDAISSSRQFFVCHLKHRSSSSFDCDKTSLCNDCITTHCNSSSARLLPENTPCFVPLLIHDIILLLRSGNGVRVLRRLGHC